MRGRLLLCGRLKRVAAGGRRVPAHMPHLIDAVALSRLQAAPGWAAEYARTSSHRFRAGSDVQYAFAYFHFLLEGGARDHLDVAAYFSAELDADGDGALSATLNRRPCAIVTFLNGLSVRRPAPVHCAAAGAALAQLHLAGEGFAITRANALGPAGWKPLVEVCQPHGDGVEPGLGELIGDAFSGITAAWPDLPSGVIHADLFPDNVLFMNNAVSGVIDFYFACNDMFAYDLAVMLNSWCFEADGSYKALHQATPQPNY
jgi:homoserine kinase